MKTFILKSMFRMKALNSQLFNTQLFSIQLFNIQKIVLAFTLLVSISGWALEEDEFISLDSNSTEQRAYVKATEQAKKFLREATPKLNAEDKSLAQRVYESLMTVQFRVSNNETTTQLCNTLGADAFVNQRFLDTIFVCNVFRENFQSKYNSKEIKSIAQLFIHESVHLNTITDECIATNFEINTMKKTSAGVINTANIEWFDKDCHFNFDL